MEIRTPLPPPVLGIYTMPETNRPLGCAEEQINFRGNKEHTLKRRPPLQWISMLLDENINVKHHYKQRDGRDYRLILTEDGRVFVWVDDVLTTEQLPENYMSSLDNMAVFDINDTMFILNKNKRTRMDDVIEGHFNQKTHINVTTALNYQDVLQMTVTRKTKTGTKLDSKVVTHTVQNPNYQTGDFSAADASRATNTVAQSIADQINGVGRLGGAFRFASDFIQNLPALAASFRHIGTERGWADFIALANDIDNRVAILRTLVKTFSDNLQEATGNFELQKKAIYDGAVIVRNNADTAVEDTIDVIVSMQEYITEASYDSWVADNRTVTKINALTIKPEYTGQSEETDLASCKQDLLDALTELATAEGNVTTALANWNAAKPDTEQYASVWWTEGQMIVNRVLEGCPGVDYGLTGGNELTGHWYAWGWNNLYQCVFDARAVMQAEFNTGPQDLDTVMNGSGVFRAELLGTNISCYVNIVDSEDIVEILVTKGQGDRAIKIFHPTCSNLEGIVKYAIAGSIITVTLDPSKIADKSNKGGVYYLKAVPVTVEANGTMTEVVWTETRNPWIKNKLDRTTLPHSILFGDTVRFSWIEPDKWRERTKGDEDTSPNPSFIGKTIEGIGYFQKRLMMISGDSVIMSETEDIWNFYRASALRLLVTDPIDIASSATGIDVVKWIVPHNRDMMIFAKNAQFKVSGQNPITPETVSMALTTRYDMQISASPVSIGNLIYFPVEYGVSSGIMQYSAQSNSTQDVATEITEHIVGILKGKLKLICGNSNLKFMACTTTGTSGNVLFVRDLFVINQTVINSWSEWRIPAEQEIVDMYCKDSELWLVVKSPCGIFLKRFQLEKQETKGLGELYLDDLVELTRVGDFMTVPYGYNCENAETVCVSDGNSVQPWTIVPHVFDIGDQETTYNDYIGVNGKVYIGKRYTSEIVPSRIYRKFEGNGEALIREKIRINRFWLNLEDSCQINMTKSGKGITERTQTFTATLGEETSNRVKECFSGLVQFYFKDTMFNATPRFWTKHHLSCTINQVSYTGQFITRSKGIGG